MRLSPAQQLRRQRQPGSAAPACPYLRRPASRPHAEKGRRVTARRGEIVMRIYAATLGTETNTFSPIDRKSVVSGKSVSVRLVLGGPRSIKKKNNTEFK